MPPPPPSFLFFWLDLSYRRWRADLQSLGLLLTVGLSLGLFLPPAIAYFPQRAEIDPSQLESEYHGEKGKVYFNKGL